MSKTHIRGKQSYMLETCHMLITIQIMTMFGGIHGEGLLREVWRINRGYGLQGIMRSILLLR